MLLQTTQVRRPDDVTPTSNSNVLLVVCADIRTGKKGVKAKIEETGSSPSGMILIAVLILLLSAAAKGQKRKAEDPEPETAPKNKKSKAAANVKTQTITVEKKWHETIIGYGGTTLNA